MKKNFILLILSVSFVFLSFLSRGYVSGRAKISFFDVGQGDAALFISDSQEKILIDGGPDDLVLKGLGRSLSFFDKTIESVIISHPHDDHIFGLIEVLRRYQVKYLFHDAADCSTDNCRVLFLAAKERGTKIIEVTEDRQQKSGSCQIFFWPSVLRNAKDFNNRSLIIKIVCGGKKVLLVGDAELAEEKTLFNRDLSADILKIGHHGSKTSSGLDFLQRVNPRAVFISVGVDNPFGHPSSEIIERLNLMGLRIYRSDFMGKKEFVF